MYILTVVIALGLGQTPALTSFSVPYETKEKCERAKDTSREALTKGSVILATCTLQ